MDTERFSTDLLSVNAGRESQPIVRMNNIKFLSTGHLTCNNRVVINLLVQISRITSRKLHRTEIIHVHVIEIGINMFPKLEIVVGVHNVTHTLLDVIIVNITPSNGHSIHGYDTAGMLTLIAKGMRQTEHSLNIALSLQAFGNTIISSGESTKYVRRILPSKH